MGTQSLEMSLRMSVEQEAPPAKRYWTSTELQRIYGLSNRQIQYFDEEGLIVPDKKLRYLRRYTQQQAILMGAALLIRRSFCHRTAEILPRLMPMRSRFALVDVDGAVHWAPSVGYLADRLRDQAEAGAPCILIDRDRLKDKLIKT